MSEPIVTTHLCSCNNCGLVLIDTNPKLGSEEVKLPFNVYNQLLELEEFNEDGETVPNGCPKCKTDACLSDDWLSVSDWLEQLTPKEPVKIILSIVGGNIQCFEASHPNTEIAVIEYNDMADDEEDEVLTNIHKPTLFAPGKAGEEMELMITNREFPADKDELRVIKWLKETQF